MGDILNLLHGLLPGNQTGLTRVRWAAATEKAKLIESLSSRHFFPQLSWRAGIQPGGFFPSYRQELWQQGQHSLSQSQQQSQLGPVPSRLLCATPRPQHICKTSMFNVVPEVSIQKPSEFPFPQVQLWRW